MAYLQFAWLIFQVIVALPDLINTVRELIEKLQGVSAMRRPFEVRKANKVLKSVVQTHQYSAGFVTEVRASHQAQAESELKAYVAGLA